MVNILTMMKHKMEKDLGLILTGPDVQIYNQPYENPLMFF